MFTQPQRVNNGLGRCCDLVRSTKRDPKEIFVSVVPRAVYTPFLNMDHNSFTFRV